MKITFKVMNILVYKMLRNPKCQTSAKQDARGKQKPPALYAMAQESTLEDEDEIGEGPSSGRKNKRKRTI